MNTGDGGGLKGCCIYVPASCGLIWPVFATDPANPRLHAKNDVIRYDRNALFFIFYTSLDLANLLMRILYIFPS
jgi:hypothetical protein